jgi:NADH:ubiquinone oxidoreductase subunit F (NADH-binding)
MTRTQYRIVLRNCGIINPEVIDDYIESGGYLAIANVLKSMSQEDVIELIQESGLRGRGGGGFPVGLKWEAANASQGKEKYIVCNADEGDPGAFMDRAVLEGDPHSVIEGMLIAGYTIGAKIGFVYCRAEYPLAIERLTRAINQARTSGLLGDNILGTDFSFNIEIKLGAGAFVCGEETALIQSIEGKRGEPVLKPPYPVQEGLWGKPTSVNNVETFANINPIILKGAKWFKSIGTDSSSGTKVFSLAGRINNVGLAEVPMGTTVRELVYDIGGGIPDNKKYKAAQTGGPSGGCIPESLIDTPIDYEQLRAIGSIMGSGGLIVMDETSCMVSVAKYFLEFTLHESCGKCTPCRIGNMRLYEMLSDITDGRANDTTLDTLKELCEVVKETSLCGLGQSSPNPVLSTLSRFRNEYEEHIHDKKCSSHVCTKLLKYVVIEDACVGCTLCAKACPVECISGSRKEVHFIDQSKCIKCGECHHACRFKAIEIL